MLCSIGSSYNYSNARKHGYYWRTDFFTGNISGQPSHVSWRGNTSLNWTEMNEVLYPRAIDYQVWGKDNFSITPVTLLPFMQCLEISNFDRNIAIGTKGTVQMFISDSNTQPSYRVHNGAMSGELISVGTFTRPGFKEIIRTKIKITLSKE